MPQGATLRVDGYREFLIACSNADKETKKYVRATFREVGDVVRVDASRRLASTSARSAAGYRTRVRQRGVAVEQSLPRSPNPRRRRPKFAELQLDRALEPALDQNEARTVHEFERAMDKVCDHFERTP